MSDSRKKDKSSVQKEYEKNLLTWVKQHFAQEFTKLKETTEAKTDDKSITHALDCLEIFLNYKPPVDKIEPPDEHLMFIQDTYINTLASFIYAESDRPQVLTHLNPITSVFGVELINNEMEVTPLAVIKQNVEFYLDHLTHGKKSDEYKDMDSLTVTKSLILSEMKYILNNDKYSTDKKIDEIKKLLSATRKFKKDGHEKEMPNADILKMHRDKFSATLLARPAQGGIFVALIEGYLSQYAAKKAKVEVEQRERRSSSY
jgi:hypothetical protein